MIGVHKLQTKNKIIFEFGSMIYGWTRQWSLS